jgi:CBS domain-containing protein
VVLTTPAAARSIAPDVDTVGPDDVVDAVVELMRTGATTTLLVADGSRVIGTVSLDDLGAVLLEESEDTVAPYHHRLAEASAGTASR